MPGQLSSGSSSTRTQRRPAAYRMTMRSTTAPIAMRKNRRKSGPCPRGPRGAPRWEGEADRDAEGEGEGEAIGLEAVAVGVSPTTMGVEAGTDGERAGEP